jgi:hypothetical protein
MTDEQIRDIFVANCGPRITFCEIVYIDGYESGGERCEIMGYVDGGPATVVARARECDREQYGKLHAERAKEWLVSASDKLPEYQEKYRREGLEVTFPPRISRRISLAELAKPQPVVEHQPKESEHDRA